MLAVVALSILGCSAPTLTAVGPRLVSNATATPLWVYGERLVDGQVLHVGTETLTLHVVDDHLATAMLPEGAVGGDVQCTLGEGAGTVTITIVDDVAFPIPSGLVLAGGRLWTTLASKDEVVGVALDDGSVATIATGDGPRALAFWNDALVIANEYSPFLTVATLDGLTREVAVDVGAQAVVVDGNRAFVSNRVHDDVEIVDLETGTDARIDAGIDPRAIAILDRDHLAVANVGSSDVSLLDLGTGASHPIVPTPDTTMIGGPTARFQSSIMGGKASRALVWSEALQVTFAGTIGPNIGPNEQHWAVSMNGGVSVIEGNRVARHVSIAPAVPEALALDDRRGILYVASLSSGKVTALDARALTSDETAKTAVRATLAILPPDDMPLVRPKPEWGKSGELGLEVHSGPAALALSPDGGSLWVLNRLSGVITEVDTASMTVRRDVGRLALGGDPVRRNGQVLFDSDLGGSGESCDACHISGDAEGVLYTKTDPRRIYRVPTMRGVRESAPYFTPARFPTMEIALHRVLDVVRRSTPKPLQSEVLAVSEYTNLLATRPSSYFLPDGSMPARVGDGDPRAGVGVFRARGCADCHPPPSFTVDQDEKTRGKLFDVGTPEAILLRPELQTLDPIERPPASLVGVGDTYPLLLSGAAGFGLDERGLVVSTDRTPLERVLDGAHGRGAELTPTERRDLIAYLRLL
jgi:DNA-binding beta-propeller fold protein YncE